MKNKIIDISIKHWNERYTGISGLDIAKTLNISHKQALQYLEELQNDKKGTLNENVNLYQISICLNNENTECSIKDPEPITTHIFFPSKELLENYYQNNLNVYIDDGEYKNMLHRGCNQTDLVYFEINVLAKYLYNKETYLIDDDVTGGVITLNPEYIKTVSESEIEKNFFNKIRYGKRKLKNGKISVTAILSDLSELNKQEQSYWYSYTLKITEFCDEDEDFYKFISRDILGNWTESNDPIQDIKTIIKELNEILPFDLYSNNENPYLRYPIQNTFKDFVDCNSELFKLLGPDNFKLSNLKKIYTDFIFGSSSDLIHNESERPMSSMQVMELILEKLNTELLIKYKNHIKLIKQNRIEGDHKITSPRQNCMDYINEFRQICNESKNILIRIKNEFEKFRK